MIGKLKLKEGDIFAVPLLQGDYCIGLVAREYKTIRLGYFFKKVYSRSSLPDEGLEEYLKYPIFRFANLFSRQITL